jgi:hypothetical protein
MPTRVFGGRPGRRIVGVGSGDDCGGIVRYDICFLVKVYWSIRNERAALHELLNVFFGWRIAAH